MAQELDSGVFAGTGMGEPIAEIGEAAVFVEEFVVERGELGIVVGVEDTAGEGHG